MFLESCIEFCNGIISYFRCLLPMKMIIVSGHAVDDFKREFDCIENFLGFLLLKDKSYKFLKVVAVAVFLGFC